MSCSDGIFGTNRCRTKISASFAAVFDQDTKDLEDASEQTVEEGQGHDGSLAEGVLAGHTESEGFWTLQVPPK
jgi:hypothetical protein